MRKVLFVALSLASLGLGVQLASAEKGRNCLADHAYCKAQDVNWKVCLMRFDFCVKQNQKLGLNPYGNPARFGGSPGILNNAPSVSIGKPGVTPGAKNINPGTAATTTINSRTVDAQAINRGTAATMTINAAPLSPPAKPPTAFSNGMSGHTPGGQPARGNLRVQ